MHPTNPKHSLYCFHAASMLLAIPALAAPVIDGTRDPAYGAALAVQTVNTGFGDNANELNAGYALIEAGKLHLMLTGNLENNLNALEIFIDSKAGGQSVFNSAGNGNTSNMDGLAFDTGFTADFHLFARRTATSFNLDFADLGAQAAATYLDLFSGSGSGSGLTGTLLNVNPISVAYDPSNLGGVVSGTTAANAAAAQAATTGTELLIDLSDLDYAGGPIRVMVGINNGDHNYWSNQFLGGLAAPQGNLGGDGLGGFTGEGALDFTEIAGLQYFEIPDGGQQGQVPEASTWAAAAILTAAAAWTHRRRRTRSLHV